MAKNKNSSVSFIKNYRKYIFSRSAVNFYIHLAAVIALSLFIAGSISRYISSQIFIQTVRSQNTSDTVGASTVKSSGIGEYSSILKYNLSESTVNGSLVSYARTGRVLLSSLNLDLVGTINGSINYAFFIDKSSGNKEIFIMQGEPVKPGYLLFSVHPKYVIIASGAAKTRVKINGNAVVSEAPVNEASAKPVVPAGNNSGSTTTDYARIVKKTGAYTYEINRSDINKNQLNKIFTQMQAIPNFVGGKISGFKILNMMPTGIFHYMGLKTGDVIMSIDGTPLKTPQEAINLLSGLLYQNNISIGVRRTGSNITLSYSIK